MPKYHKIKCGIVAAAAIALTSPAVAENITISSSLPQVHFWTGEYMDRFADAMEQDGDTTFTRFYAGELVKVGGGLDALNGGTVDVIAPLLAPYHAGRFPLSDISQLPVYNTDAASITRAFQALLDSDVELTDGKTFYDYDVGGKNIHVWALGATGAYTISTTGKRIVTPADFKGVPIRAGAALQTITLQELGVNPVTMPASQAYEALSRNTIEGILLSIADWKSFSLLDTLKYTIDGVALGHWESYFAISDAGWDKLSDAEKVSWDRIARQTAIANAEFIIAQEKEVRTDAATKGAEFVSVGSMSEEMQAHFSEASLSSWKQWIETLEGNGHPGRAAASLWADLVVAEGGKLPDGVAEYLAN